MYPTKFPQEGSYSLEELTEWLNNQDIYVTIGIIEKEWKDLRDYILLSLNASNTSINSLQPPEERI